MVQRQSQTSSELPSGSTPRETRGERLIPLAMALFFAFGFCTVLVDTLTPKLKGMFALSYTEVMLTPFAFFGAYFLVSLPASWLLSRIGYLQSITVGLVVTAAGCMLFTPAASLGVYSAFLFAVFVMASGITLVQVAANPLTTAIGDPRFTHSRLTLAQAFNSLATMIGPLFGAALILGHGEEHARRYARFRPPLFPALRIQEAHSVQGPFFGIAVALVLLAGVCVLFFRASPRTTADGRLLLRSLAARSAADVRRDIDFPLRRGGGRDRQPAHQLSDVPKCAGGEPTGRRIPGQHLLGPGDGGPICRSLRPAQDKTRRRSGDLRPGGGSLGGSFRTVERRCRGGRRACDRAFQFHHVPDDIHPGDRKSG